MDFETDSETECTEASTLPTLETLNEKKFMSKV